METELLQTSKKLQILAPAGSVEQLKAAVNNGCDCVYLGLDSFNARMKAPNFTLDNLSAWIDYCHLFDVKVYVAINTSLKNDEFKKAVELLKSVYLRNADGVIVTDIALMQIAGALPKPFDVVASTQLNVHDKYGAEFVKKHGATTVVCARECSLNDIREIASTGIGVECFLHGAMCVCQSGQCLFSSMVGGNSGNRGLCAQPCRKYYIADGDAVSSGYLLSASDMCSLETLTELVNVGATTFKIEGRNRRPEYAGLTSQVYKNLINNDFVPNNGDYSSLAEMYNRGMSSNHYLQGGNSGIIYPSVQNHIGVEVGIVKHGGVAAFKKLNKGDGLKVFDGDREVCGGVVLESGQEFVKAQFGAKVSDGMRVHRTTSIELCEAVLSVRRKLDVSMEFVAIVGQYPKLIARCNNIAVEVYGDSITQQAIKNATDSSEITQQLRKTGETCYTICDIVIKIDNIFIAKSQINALRRQVLDKLTESIVNNYNKKFVSRSGELKIDRSIGDDTIIARVSKAPVCAAICYDEQQIADAAEVCDFLIYKPRAIDSQAFETALRYNAYLDLPSFISTDYICKLLTNMPARLLCNNVGHVELARSLSVDYIAGGGLNIFNDYIASVFPDAKTFIYSRELTLREIDSFKNASGLTFVDGQIPLMQLCHCPYKVAFSCDCDTCKSNSKLVYRDELNNKFELRRRKAGLQCVFELFNGNKLSVVNKLKKSGRYLLDYDNAVLRHYLNVNNGIDDGYAELKPYTKGRLYDKIN